MEEEPFGLGCALESFVELDEVKHLLDEIKNNYSDQSKRERAYERFLYIFNQYKEQPHLLDPYLEGILDKCISMVRDPNNVIDVKHVVFEYMFIIVNVRGYKVIVRQLPHEVTDFEVVLKFLESQDPNDTNTWSTRYILLLWLSIIVMIPFDLSRFDGSDVQENKTVMNRVLDIIKRYVVVPDKCRDAATYLSARFITRQDVKTLHLESFLNWAIDIGLSSESESYARNGTLSAIAMIFKYGKREDLLPYTQILLSKIVNEKNKSNVPTTAVVQKMQYKIIQRIGLTFLPPRLAAWRYTRGNRSLAANLNRAVGDSAHLPQPQQTIIDNTPEDISVPDEIEEIIDQLVHGLRCTDGIVRWSAAKGIGRVTCRLPQELADEVVGCVLELFTPREGDGAWHGGCLALAELGRRGLLLPKRLPEVVPVILQALVYDEPKLTFSVGSHVRDAACYVCWSFARAYETEDLKPFVNQIASILLVVTCFDREINCRRAASAAFQENVGRQGSFPHGIEILTVADFFGVSVRQNAYLNISVFVSQFSEYTIPLIDHLLNKKIDHWDLNIRELAAKALHNLTPRAPEYMVETVLPALFKRSDSIDMNCRHGTVLAIGEILYALSKCDKNSIESKIGENLVTLVKTLIPKFREKFYLRGTGGELTRQACCDFIEKCCLAKFDFKNDRNVTEDWLKLINEGIAYNVPNMQKNATSALPVVINEYYSTDIAKIDSIIEQYIKDLLFEFQQELRIGYALALGAMPECVLKLHMERIVTALIKAAQITPLTEKWAESRRDAIKALSSISIKMANKIGTEIPIECFNNIYDAFLNGIYDYTQDKTRGDVGAWIREASMLGLQGLSGEIIKIKPEFLTEEFMKKIMVAVAQQTVDKIDRTRAVGVKVFYSFLYNVPPYPHIPHCEELQNIVAQSEFDQLNLNSAAVTFPIFVELLQFDEYAYAIMIGLVCSIGGLTESLVKNSSAAFFAYLRKIEETKGKDEINKLCNIVQKIFEDYKKDDRVIIPMLKFLEKLFSSGCINCILEDVNNEFPRKILKLMQQEVVGCGNVYKLVDGISAFSQYIQIKNETCQSALVQISIYLCHRHAYVRRSASNILYEALLVYGDSANINTKNLDEVLQVLSDTNWENAVEEVKPIRNKLCQLMGIRVPVAKPRPIVA